MSELGGEPHAFSVALLDRGEEMVVMGRKHYDQLSDTIFVFQREIERLHREKDAAYTERNRVVALAASLAVAQGLPAGRRKHEPDPDPEWPEGWSQVVHIALPTGQVSWHLPDAEAAFIEALPQYEGSWDGHTNAEKNERMDAFVKRSLP